MQSYRARYERGWVVPLGNPAIPEGSSLIVTVLDIEDQQDIIRQQAEAMHRFRENIKNCNEPVPEFEPLKLREVEI